MPTPTLSPRHQSHQHLLISLAYCTVQHHSFASEMWARHHYHSLQPHRWFHVQELNCHEWLSQAAKPMLKQ